MTGKGNCHLVPVLIPEDTVAAIQKISDPRFQAEAGVAAHNKFLFASVQGSEEGHLSGWHSVHEICTKLNLKNPKVIVATNNRHRISTIFASLHVPEKDRALFYAHMGHSEEINRNIYQAPPAIQEITKVGRHLLDIDQGNFICYPNQY